jgi:uncharacterized membrane protein YkvA (DUF1232 family)
MVTREALIYGLVAFLAAYAASVLALVVAGRHSDAKALARFIPDCLVLTKRLIEDDRVPRSRKVALAALVAYLVFPIDLIPDFIPVAGQLDDAILVVLTLQFVLKATNEAVIRELWPGPTQSLGVVLRAGARATGD